VKLHIWSLEFESLAILVLGKVKSGNCHHGPCNIEAWQKIPHETLWDNYMISPWKTRNYKMVLAILPKPNGSLLIP
jgi:hypothetical protein